MARSVLFIKHIEYETGGHATTLLSHLPTREAVFPTSLPTRDELAGVVILGGQMSAAEVDEFPSLALTADLALRAIDEEIPVLGLCLGHQILGRALGAEHLEGIVDHMGIVDIEVLEADPWLGGRVGTFGAMRWNSDVVSLPPGAIQLARSETVANEAFRYGSAGCGCGDRLARARRHGPRVAARRRARLRRVRGGVRTAALSRSARASPSRSRGREAGLR